MTMKQLAEIAKVSVSTVSKAFSGSREISEEKRKYIFEIARKSGCYDKYCKPLFKKKVIAVICPEFQSGYYSQHLTYLKKEIGKHTGVMVAASCNFDKHSKKELLSYFTEIAKVDGVIIVGSDVSKMNYSTPIVVIGDSENFDSISLSMKTAIKDVVDCLLEKGHTDIAFIGETLTGGKFKLFEQAMQEKGLKINNDYVIERKERFEEAGYYATNILLEMEKVPTAIVAAYDSIAIGAMKSIYEHGLSIPEDISLVGMDDNREAAYLNVPLTSITSYSEDLCEIAVDLLFDRIENKGRGKIKKIKVSTEFVPRESVGKVKNR